MSTKILMIVTLVFVCTNTGYGFLRHVNPLAHLESSTFKAPMASLASASVASSNGSTLETILKELDKSTTIQSGCQFSRGTFGGGGGGSFNELLDNCGAVVQSILVRSGSRLDAIQITYRFSNGQVVTGGYFGGRGGGAHRIDINVDGGERVVGVFGRSGGSVDQIGFTTNKGRIFGPYGGCGGGPFTVNSCHLRGIFGRSGSRIDSIGFHCSNA